MSNGTCTQYHYRVEVRAPHFSHVHPCALADGIVGSDWRAVTFPSDNNNLAGVPAKFIAPYIRGLGYESAVALAWTIIAQNPHHSLETRIVQYKVELQWKETEVGVIDGTALHQPDWELKATPKTNEPK